MALRHSRLPLLAALFWLSAGCSATGDEIRPPDDQFYFPTGMDIAPDGSVLFVANANSDLRFDSGSAEIVDLQRVDDIIEVWLATRQPPEGRSCQVDLSVPYTLVCDEREAIVADGTVRMGNFATELRVETLDDMNTLRLFAAVRGDPSLTWMDYDVASRTLSCGPTEGFPECDDEHRLSQLRNDEALPALPDEPFGLFVDSATGYVVVTHLSNGAISLATAPTSGDTPFLSDAVGNLFGFGSDGQRGAVGVAGRAPTSEDDRIYVTSRRDSRVQTLAVQKGDGGFQQLVPTEYFFMRGTITPSSDARGIAFSSDGNRAYIVNRAPPMLHIFDTSIDETGVPKNEFVSGVEICAQASNLVVYRPEGEPGESPDDPSLRPRIFVTCFGTGQIWSIDPNGAVVDHIIDIGRGPQSVVVSPRRHRLYVSNNLENTVAVVDLSPGPTENRVVLRLGRPKSSSQGTSGDDVQ
ncbi:MAG TPA: hypothetical protein VKB80_11755 [Kofleriaceae bacterium]|nr:hypothetical protein [Kofleriaceae bacterium]